MRQAATRDLPERWRVCRGSDKWNNVLIPTRYAPSPTRSGVLRPKEILDEPPTIGSRLRGGPCSGHAGGGLEEKGAPAAPRCGNHDNSSCYRPMVGKAVTKIEPYGIYWQAWRSRLQGVAEPNAVVIAESTRRPHAGSWATVFFLCQLVGALLTASHLQ
jgi:hypothetical protein